MHAAGDDFCSLSLSLSDGLAARRAGRAVFGHSPSDGKVPNPANDCDLFVWRMSVIYSCAEWIFLHRRFYFPLFLCENVFPYVLHGRVYCE